MAIPDGVELEDEEGAAPEEDQPDQEQDFTGRADDDFDAVDSIIDEGEVGSEFEDAINPQEVFEDQVEQEQQDEGGGEDADDEGEDQDDRPEEEEAGSDSESSEEEDGGQEGEDQGEQSGDEQVDEDGPFYDPERDFAEELEDGEISPNHFETLADARQALVSKAAYIEDQVEALEELGGGVGALQLPDIAGNVDELVEKLNLEDISEMSDEQVHQTIMETDKFINKVKNKKSRFQEAKQAEETVGRVEELQEQLASNLQQTVEATGADLSDFDPDEHGDEFVLDRIDEAIESFEEGAEDYIDENGYDEFSSKLNEMTSARDELIGTYEDLADAVDQADQVTKEDKSLSQEEFKGTYKEFKQDRPDLDIFDNDYTERAFLQTVKQKGWKDEIRSTRDWLKVYEKYDELRNEVLKRDRMKSEKERAEEDAEDRESEDNSDQEAPPVRQTARGANTNDGLYWDDQVEKAIDDVFAGAE